MSGVGIAFLSIAAMLILIYSGMHVAIALILLSFGGVWLLHSSFDIASNMVVLAFKDAISDYLFGVVPLFVLMGLLVAVAGIGRDTFEVAAQVSAASWAAWAWPRWPPTQSLRRSRAYRSPRPRSSPRSRCRR